MAGSFLDFGSLETGSGGSDGEDEKPRRAAKPRRSRKIPPREMDPEMIPELRTLLVKYKPRSLTHAKAILKEAWDGIPRSQIPRKESKYVDFVTKMNPIVAEKYSHLKWTNKQRMDHIASLWYKEGIKKAEQSEDEALEDEKNEDEALEDEAEAEDDEDEPAAAEEEMADEAEMAEDEEDELPVIPVAPFKFTLLPSVSKSASPEPEAKKPKKEKKHKKKEEKKHKKEKKERKKEKKEKKAKKEKSSESEPEKLLFKKRKFEATKM